MVREIKRNIGVDINTPIEFHDFCPQCGQEWHDSACGPGHAIVADRRRRAFVKLTDALGRYLEVHGWRAIVAGAVKIQQPEPGQPFDGSPGRYQLAITFTGGRRKWPADQSERSKTSTRKTTSKTSTTANRTKTKTTTRRSRR